MNNKAKKKVVNNKNENEKKKKDLELFDENKDIFEKKDEVNKEIFIPYRLNNYRMKNEKVLNKIENNLVEVEDLKVTEIDNDKTNLHVVSHQLLNYDDEI
jgi:hypothetical protein